MSYEEKNVEKEIIRFNKRSQINNKILNRIFKLGDEKNNKRNEVTSVPDNETPYFIVLVGSPGVGKTTTIKNIIKDRLGKSYHNFFHISLDFIVERVQPYRNSTNKAYKNLKGNRKNTNVTNENFAKLSKFYLSYIGSKTENFKTLKNTTFKKIKYNEPLYDLVDTGIIHGIKNRYNIIYDTTFDGSYKKLNKIVTYLENNQKEHPDKNKYKIMVILVTASDEVVESQLRKRHRNMIKEGYIRAINISQVRKKFIKDNKLGFNAAKQYYRNNINNQKHNKSVLHYNNEKDKHFYNTDDFEFIEIDNTRRIDNTSELDSIVNNFTKLSIGSQNESKNNT